jgi:type VI secretion system secreted protein VgrG
VQEGNRSITVSKGNDTHTVTKGNRVVKVDAGNDTLTVAQGNIGVKASAGAITIEAAQSITLKVGANKIVISTSGIVIEAPGGKVEVKPAGVTASGPTVGLKADAQASVEGAIVKVAGSGIVQVQGALVKIN